MDPDREEDVFSDAEDSFPLREDQEEKDEEEEEDEEENARIFNAWMQQYRGGEHQKKQVQEEKEENEEDMDSEGGRPESRCSFEPPVQMRVDRRSSLPCPVRKHKVLLMFNDAIPISQRRESDVCSVLLVDLLQGPHTLKFCPRIQNNC